MFLPTPRDYPPARPAQPFSTTFFRRQTPPGLASLSAFFASPASPFDQRAPFFASRTWFFDYPAAFVTLERRPLELAARPLTIARGPSAMGHGTLAIGPDTLPLGCRPLPLVQSVFPLTRRSLRLRRRFFPLGLSPFPLGRRTLTIGQRFFQKERRSLTIFYEKRVSKPPENPPKPQQTAHFPQKRPFVPFLALARPPNRPTPAQPRCGRLHPPLDGRRPGAVGSAPLLMKPGNHSAFLGQYGLRPKTFRLNK
jgi:hypothetical protein